MTKGLKERPYYCVKEVEHLTGRTRCTLGRWRKNGYMPQAVEIGPNSIGWYIDVLDAWLLSRPTRVSPPKPKKPSRESGLAMLSPA